MHVAPRPRPLPLLALLLGACYTGGPTLEQLEADMARARSRQAESDAFSPSAPLAAPEWHRGPGVQRSPNGPARFVEDALEGFDAARAMRTVLELEGSYRTPANDGYERAIELLIGHLHRAGYGVGDPRFELTVLESEAPVVAWNPRSGSVVLVAAGAEPRVLHDFAGEGDPEQVLLPVGAPAADVEGPIAMSLTDVAPGSVLVTEVPLPQVLARAAAAGAAAVVSASLGTYNVDPTGADRHLDAIQYRVLDDGTPLPAFQISPRSYEAIASAAAAGGGATLRLRAEVETVERRLRTVVAELVGRQRPDEVVGISSHLQEPGAGDNASGVATLLEGATLLAERVASGELDRPDRTIAFVWGDEFRQTEMFLEGSTRKVVAGLSADMTGQSFELTGAIALLERMPDPGAIRVLPPDEHSAWGAGDVTREDIVETGLAVVARCALLDVGLAEDGWLTADHPWEGGSDHDVYLEHGVPAVLFWHFTDFAYHTSLDRPELVDPAEMRRTGAAILTTALALADPRPSDLDRYLVSLDAECALRIAAAEAAEDAELVEMWREWGLGARSWLRVLCLRLEQDEAREVLGRQ